MTEAGSSVLWQVVCPDGGILLTDPDYRIAQHHAAYMSSGCACDVDRGGRAAEHVVRGVRTPARMEDDA